MTIGHNVGRVVITLYMHKLDHALISGFPSVVIVKDVWLTLEFAIRHDGIIGNQNIISKHKRDIIPIYHVNWNANISQIITGINNLVCTYMNSRVFTTIGVSFGENLWFGVPPLWGLV